MKILVLNSGSSSQKSCLYEIREALPEAPPAPLWEGKIEWNGDEATLELKNAAGRSHKEKFKNSARLDATAHLLSAVTNGPVSVLADKKELGVVGHRIVNGGPEFRQPTVVTPEIKAAIQKAAIFAPLHNRVELEGIAMIEKAFEGIPQVAVFDTGFHRHMPDAATIYPGPYEWAEQGVRRYGFHGINHQYCAARAAQLIMRNLDDLRIVSCHLGNGCSLAAIRGGHSVDTTMGFTPLEGLMMGTRSGSIDQGILTFLMRERKINGSDLDELLNEKSGLLGISGISSDMRQVISAMKNGHARAKLAFEIFIHRLQTGIGAMAAAIGGIDALIFTAGIGENSLEVRAAACANLEFLGLELDTFKNQSAQADVDISKPRSRARVLVLKAQEDWAIAQACWQLLGSPQHVN